MLNRSAFLEKAWLRLQRRFKHYELEAWLDEAMLRLAHTVAAGPNFRTLQRTFAVQLGAYDAPVEFRTQLSYSNAEGWGTGVTISADGKTLTGTIDSFIVADATTELLPGELLHKDQYWEFTWDSEVNQPVSFVLLPTTLPVSALRPSVLVEQPDVVFGITVEQQGRLAGWAAGNPVLNPDTTMPIGLGDRVRIYCDATTGQVKVQHFQTSSVILAQYSLVTYADALVPFTINQPVIPALLFHDSDVTNARIKNVRVGVRDPFAAQLPPKVIHDSIRTRGGVRFENGRALGFVGDGDGLGLPRIKGQWSYALVDDSVRIVTSPTARKVCTGASEIWRYQSLARAWERLSAVPAGVSLASASYTAGDNPGIVAVAANGSLTVNSTTAAVEVQLPRAPANGTVVRLLDSSPSSWGVNSVTLAAVDGSTLKDAVLPSARRLSVTGNIVPTLEEVPDELGEAALTALLEIAREAERDVALKEKAQRYAPKIKPAEGGVTVEAVNA